MTTPAPPTRSALLLAVAAALPAAGCGDAGDADAYGTFEADEITVSAEAAGRLVRFLPREGERLQAGERVAVVDTVDAVLRLRELTARRQAASARRDRAAREIEAVRAELEAAREELARDRRLFEDSAATARELNQRRREVRVLEGRLEAARAERRSGGEEAASLQAAVERARKRLREDSFVENPVDGVVLVTYADAGEHVRVGQPLYDVARLDTLRLHAFVTGAQLARVRPGQEVDVRFDVGEDALGSRTGRVVRVADEAEFTPTPILTREERVSFVYEIEIAVPNGDGVLKIGMPAEVDLPAPETR